MSPRLAWLALAVTVGLVLVLLPLTWATADHEGAEVFFGLAFVAYAIVGALIASRQPRNPVGWLFCAVGLLSAGSETLHSYAISSGRPSGSAVAGWLSAWSSGPGAVTIVLILLLFPTGDYLSRGWRLVGTVAVAHAIVWATATALNPGPLPNIETASNPVGIDGASGLLEPITDVAGATYWLLALAGVISVVARFRGARTHERQQIKCLVVAAGFAAAAILATSALGLVVDTDRGVGDLLTALMVASAVSAFPVAAGIAILRHRLYDIDVVIKRTLVYGSLTAALVGTYLLFVLMLQVLLRPLAGESDLAVAVSTLAVAALFRPLRARIQSVVDRRFYRSRYDAARTLEGFSAHLRGELDLDTLGTDLRAVVRKTMQPAHVTLWLRRAEP